MTDHLPSWLTSVCSNIFLVLLLLLSIDLLNGILDIFLVVRLQLKFGDALGSRS